MKQATVVVPNYNGIAYLENCLRSLEQDSLEEFDIIVVDNASVDKSEQIVSEQFRQMKLIRMETNTGFCRAVNAGIQAAKTPYVILLNNDTTVEPGFVKYMTAAMERDERIFSASAQMRSMKEPEKIDDAGDRYSAFGWAYARGKGETSVKYQKDSRIFASCGGAAIYRKSILEQIGMFDENHFAYLEDIDIGYRAKIFGYYNVYEPRAVVYHAGSAASGSRYNPFKIRLSSKNSIYLVYKNMPLLQLILNLPFLLAGFSAKLVFFMLKGFGGIYAEGIMKGLRLSLSAEGKKNKIPFQFRHLGNYGKIQAELWLNMILRKV